MGLFEKFKEWLFDEQTETTTNDSAMVEDEFANYAGATADESGISATTAEPPIKELTEIQKIMLKRFNNLDYFDDDGKIVELAGEITADGIFRCFIGFFIQTFCEPLHIGIQRFFAPNSS